MVFILAAWALIHRSGKGLRPKAEDKGSKAKNDDKIPRGPEGHRNEVSGGGMVGGTGGGNGTIARTVIVTTVIATTDTPMSPRAKCTDSHCPQTPEEVGTVIVPLSEWRTGQKDEMSQKNRATHQTRAP